MKIILNYLKRLITPEIKYILIIFLITRIVLTITGVTTRAAFKNTNNGWSEWNYSKSPILTIWGVWDSGWYLDIAENGYSTKLMSDLPKKVCCGQANIGFFPLYPILIHFVGKVFGDYALAGIIISNIALILAAVFLVKLLEIDHKNDEVKRIIKYLFLFPTSFILSAIFSESLFLLLAILCFYFAKKKKWLWVGISGLFLSLNRPTGVLVAIPLFSIYLKGKGFLMKKIKLDLFYFLLFPLGLLLFMFYTYKLTGDFFAYFHMKQLNWNAVYTNPMSVLISLFQTNSVTRMIAVFTAIEIALLIIFLKKINFPYFIYSLIIILMPLVNGLEIAIGIPRMSVVAFPLFIILAKIAKKPVVDYLLTISLISLQIFFMLNWTNGYLII